MREQIGNVPEQPVVVGRSERSVLAARLPSRQEIERLQQYYDFVTIMPLLPVFEAAKQALLLREENAELRLRLNHA